MLIYTNPMIETFNKNIDDILLNGAKLENEVITPSHKTFTKIIQHIVDYSIKHGLVIYGGYAMNLMLDEKIYDDKIDKPDIEFYSHEPIRHLVSLADDFHQDGHTLISVREGIHIDTFKLKVDGLDVCDATFMPSTILSNVPTINIKKLLCVKPSFMLIDYYRMFNDVTSIWRVQKSFKRFSKLQKQYQYDKITKPLLKMKDNGNISAIKGLEVVIIGFYSYNHYVDEHAPITCTECISTKYKEHTSNLNEKFKHQEFFPFFQFTDRFTEYYDDNDKLFLRVYGNNNYCIPYHELSPRNDKTKIKIGTFSVTFLYLNIMHMYHKTVRINDNMAFQYNACASKLLQAREVYYITHKTSDITKGLFKEFDSARCVGSTMKADVVRTKLRLHRFQKKYRVSYIYDPLNPTNDIHTYKYQMSNGRAIIDKKD